MTPPIHFYDGGVLDRDWDRMDLAAIQPYWLTEQFPLSYLPCVAQVELDRNRGGDAVLMLFALDSPDTSSVDFLDAYRADVNGLVLRALREVGAPEMTIGQAWRHVIREEAARVVHGDDYERATGAENLGWIFWKTRMDVLREFEDLDLESEVYWDNDSRGPIDRARVNAAERLLQAFDSAR